MCGSVGRSGWVSSMGGLYIWVKCPKESTSSAFLNIDEISGYLVLGDDCVRWLVVFIGI